MTIYTCIYLSILTIILSGVMVFVIKPYLEEKNKIDKMKADNDKMNIFMQMDPKIALEEIAKIIDDNINEYVLHKFIVYKIEFIKSEDIEKMIKELDKKMLLELPELYIFYIRMLCNISTDNDLIVFLHKKISERVLKFTSEFNRPRE